MKLTAAELSALPERKDYVDIMITDEGDPRGRPGTTVRQRIPVKFRTWKRSPDDVILFHDAEGSWFVDWHLEGGPFKRRACL